MAKMIIPTIDYTNEKSTLTLYVEDAITDPNFTLLFNATDPLILDGEQQSKLVTEAGKDGADTGKATDPFAQRETKWLGQFRDSAGDVGTFEIPCADLQYVTVEGGLDLTAGVGLAFKTQFDSLARSRKGLTVTLEQMTHVGRKT